MGRRRNSRSPNKKRVAGASGTSQLNLLDTDVKLEAEQYYSKHSYLKSSSRAKLLKYIWGKKCYGKLSKTNSALKDMSDERIYTDGRFSRLSPVGKKTLTFKYFWERYVLVTQRALPNFTKRNNAAKAMRNDPNKLFKHKFAQYDKDNSGILEYGELEKIAIDLSYEWKIGSHPLTQEEQHMIKTELMQKLDQNKGKVTLDEFIVFSKETEKSITDARNIKETAKQAPAAKESKTGMTDDERRIFAVFSKYDKNGDGDLSAAELMRVAEDIYAKFHPDTKMTGNDLIQMHHKMLLRHDVNGDGVLDFKEFYGWYSGLATDMKGFEAVQKKREPPVYNITQANARAKKMFDKYDKDGSGILERKELTKIAEWVLVMFHPDKQVISHSKKIQLREKLLERLDKNKDGKMDFKEFEVWFAEITQEIRAFRRRRAQEKKALEEEGKALSKWTDLHPRLRKKFDEFDTDGSRKLEGKELNHLVEWVWSVFHPEGKMLSHQEKVAMREELMATLDENHDGQLNVTEFGAWCEKTFKEMTAFRKQRAQELKKAATPSKPAAAAPICLDMELWKRWKQCTEKEMTCDPKKDDLKKTDEGLCMRGERLATYNQRVLKELPPPGTQGDALTEDERAMLVNLVTQLADFEQDGFMGFQRFAAFYQALYTGFPNWYARRHMAPVAKTEPKAKGDSGFSTYFGAFMIVLLGLFLVKMGEPDQTIQLMANDFQTLVANL